MQARCVRGPGNKRCPVRNAKRELKNTMSTISTSADLDLLSVSAVGCDFDKYSKYSQYYYQIDRMERYFPGYLSDSIWTTWRNQNQPLPVWRECYLKQ